MFVIADGVNALVTVLFVLGGIAALLVVGTLLIWFLSVVLPEPEPKPETRLKGDEHHEGK